MPNLSIAINGVDEINRNIGKVNIPSVMRRPMERTMIRLQGRMADYPPPPANSRYRRSGSYGRRWTYAIVVTGNTITGKVGNNLRYAPLVGSARFQTRRHKATGWANDEQVLREETQNIVRDFEQGIQEELRRAGL